MPRSGRCVSLKKSVHVHSPLPQIFRKRTMSQVAQQRTDQATDKVIYTAKTHTTGGRENGVSRSSDGRLDVRFSTPGSERIGATPEQLFASAWSACFESAIALAARGRKIMLPADVAIDANQTDSGYFLSVRLNVSLPGIARDVARALMDDAHRICPYSKATHGNID